MKKTDLLGQKFGKLTVIDEATSIRTKSGNVMAMWKCRCDCGNECVVLANNLKRGHTNSCGCYREELRPTLKYVHGYTKTRIYDVWSKIKSRCYKENDCRYHIYGGRGITMCDEWKNNPISFIEWAFANGYDENAKYGETTIDRIDNNKGYSPENCRIANERVQRNNRRTNHKVTYCGETHTIAEWSRILNVNVNTLTTGVHNGKSIEYYMTDYRPRNTHPKQICKSGTRERSFLI